MAGRYLLYARFSQLLTRIPIFYGSVCFGTNCGALHFHLFAIDGTMQPRKGAAFKYSCGFGNLMMKGTPGMRIMVVALLLAMGAVVILALGETFNIWASNGLINISLILLIAIPLSMIGFVFLSHREQEQGKNEKGEDGSSKAP
jgi:hypothetical protein